MVCTVFGPIETISDFLVWPTGCDYYFYLKIFLGIWLVVAWILFKTQEDKETKADMISSMAISSVAVFLLASIGTIIKNASDVPMVQSDILMYLLAKAIALLMIWIWTKSV